MDQKVIVEMSIIVFFLILLHRYKVFQILEIKVLSLLAAIFMCSIFLVFLNNIWNSDKTKIYVNMPSITFMKDFYNEFYEKYNGKHVSYIDINNFWENELKEVNIFEKNQSEILIKNIDEAFSEVFSDNNGKVNNFHKIEDFSLGSFFNNEISMFLKKISKIFVPIIIIYIIYQIFILPRYCNIIEKQIKSYGHVLMGKNTLEDILISVNVITKNTWKKSNLCSFMLREIHNKKNGLYFLIGQAGEGKSVALRQLTLMIIGEMKRVTYRKKIRLMKVPILISIPEINSFEETKFTEQICKKIIQISLGKKFSFLSNQIYSYFKYIFIFLLNNGNLFYLLDGYDEINESKRYAFVRMLEKMKRKYNNCIFIVSSRTYVFMEDNYPILRTGTVLNLSLLSKDQIYEFINKWSFNHKQASELYHRISVNTQLVNLASNPLVLTLICYMFDKNVKIEHNTILEFYIEASRCILKTWEEDKTIQKRIKLPINVKEEALSALAYFQLNNHQSTWSSKKDVIKSFKECAEKNGILPINILDEISMQAGILECVSNKFYRFYHRSFYEFYSAMYMFNNNINIEILENDVELHCNIISFYLLFKSDIELTNKMLKNHSDKQKFISQIIRFCDVNDEEFIIKYISKYLENIDEKNTNSFKDVGELAKRYPIIQGMVRNKLNQIYKCKNSTDLIKENCFITYTYFESVTFLTQYLFDNFSSKNVIEIILMADDTIDKVIYNLANANLGKEYLCEIFDGLSLAYKYDLLFRIMIGSKDERVKQWIMGCFLQCTKEKVFLEWLEDKELILNEKKDTVIQINSFIKKYGWCNRKFSSSVITNFYVIIWHTLELLDDKNYRFDLNKIDNNMKFIITYLKNVKNPIEIRNYLIDINNYKVVSLVEFDYHWKRVSKKKIKVFGKDPILMNNITAFAIMASNIVLMFYYLLITVDLPVSLLNRSHLEKLLVETFFVNTELFKKYDVTIIQISKYIKFNTLYFLIVITMNIVQKFLHNCLSQITFKKYYIIYHFLIALALIDLYCIIISEVNFRCCYVILSCFLMLIGIVQHKNNYPAFKNPLFTEIRQFLC